MRHLFVVDSLDPLIQNEKELIHPVSAGGRGLFCICVESINLNLNIAVECALVDCIAVRRRRLLANSSSEGGVLMDHPH